MPYAPTNPAAIVFDFAAWLTTRPETTMFGSGIDAAPAAKLCGEYLKERGYPDRPDDGDFIRGLSLVINAHARDAAAATPDVLLAEFAAAMFSALARLMIARRAFFARKSLDAAAEPNGPSTADIERPIIEATGDHPAIYRDGSRLTATKPEPTSRDLYNEAVERGDTIGHQWGKGK